jgi:DNA-3-methyladenine glycosylase
MKDEVLPAAFYARPTLEVAEDLLGKVLVHTVRGRTTAGIIVETEAYIGESDPACHAAPGPTPRNAPLYGPPGRAYVYLNYGIHRLVNAVTEPAGSPAAVLIRALEPLEGLDLMRRRRSFPRTAGSSDPADRDLCRGPGNLTKALGIDLSRNCADLTAAPERAGGWLVIEDRGIQPGAVDWTPRIGIRVGTNHRWRCIWREHPCVSGGRAASV